MEGTRPDLCIDRNRAVVLLANKPLKKSLMHGRRLTLPPHPRILDIGERLLARGAIHAFF